MAYSAKTQLVLLVIWKLSSYLVYSLYLIIYVKIAENALNIRVVLKSRKKSNLENCRKYLEVCINLEGFRSKSRVLYFYL